MVYEGVSTVWVKFQSVKVGELGDGGGKSWQCDGLCGTAFVSLGRS